MFDPLKSSDFKAIKLKLASPEQIHAWSCGEVLRPETINYRTQKPEKDGLFCEKIFGPSKDWECYCGKYRKIRYKGIVCDKCGVEVTRALVRRERMGHIDLAAPTTHIWFLRGVPSSIGLLLDLSTTDLEKIVYFASFIITNVDENLKESTLQQIKEEYKNKKRDIENDFKKAVDLIKKTGKEEKKSANVIENELIKLNKNIEEKRADLDEIFNSTIKELQDIKPLKVITENIYHDFSLKYGHIFEASIGAEAIYKLLKEIDLDKLIKILKAESEDSKSKYQKYIRRIKLATSLKMNKIRPEWMIMTVVPIIPPDLRPMVPLDGGRFATADLNDLYRRVINRNNRLKQLLELNAPEVICRNERRMLQEAVDALIDNSTRHGKTVTASNGQKRQLKSIADILKGKQGRFRQNLLGKRIDYSGRSVIVVGPNLNLDQCGLPKRMALELFKPFVMSELIKRGFVHNIRSAARFIESDRTQVWDILEEVITDSYVMLNRAPTLHRLGVQAFKPILIEGKAIQVHPLVCAAFNADFDGDQMAVHVPLTDEARWEAKNIMLSTKNLLKPATGSPVATPNQDIVWGCFYMTMVEREYESGSDKEKMEREKRMKVFHSTSEVILAYQLNKIKLQDLIKVVDPQLIKYGAAEGNGEITITSVGRILFNQIIPAELPYYNKAMTKKELGAIVKLCLVQCGQDRTVQLLDDMKRIGFSFLSKSGLSWSMDDLSSIPEKDGLIEKAEKSVEETEEQFQMGLLTNNERHQKIIEIWSKVKEDIAKIANKALDPKGSVFSMIESGARGSWSQLIQMVGMKGLVVNPAGDIIELPVKGNFKEGFDVLEFFISTHGARKGLSDTALRTASAGYLTRRLVDVSQEVIIREDDCGDAEGLVLTKKESEEMGENLIDRIVGRYAVEAIKNPKTGKVFLEEGGLINESMVEDLKKFDLDCVKIRSIVSCKSHKGICVKCYGIDLGYNKLVKKGTAVGVIAAQSIGEPGTQLTMMTFHTGGVAGSDITQGLPRVEELFEARNPKKRAFLSDVSGKVKIEEAERIIKDIDGKEISVNAADQKIIKIYYKDNEEIVYTAKKGSDIKVEKDSNIKKDQVLFITKDGVEIQAKESGVVKNVKDKKIVMVSEVDKIMEYVIPAGYVLFVKDGDLVNSGDQLTGGSIDLKQLFSYKDREFVQKYILKEVQFIYSSQGQKLKDKHVEIIIRQMFSRVLIKSSGDTDFLPGEVVERSEIEVVNENMTKKKRKPAVFEQLLLGITKVSLSTNSWLAAASFQETQRVLINAAVSGKVDRLEGLKENVIIGRLIPVGTGFPGYKMEGLEEMRKRSFSKGVEEGAGEVLEEIV
ncbi:MAG: DNA-directed RNA polymerase subunit beta' [bacterium]